DFIVAVVWLKLMEVRTGAELWIEWAVGAANEIAHPEQAQGLCVIKVEVELTIVSEPPDTFDQSFVLFRKKRIEPVGRGESPEAKLERKRRRGVQSRPKFRMRAEGLIDTHAQAGRRLGNVARKAPAARVESFAYAEDLVLGSGKHN